MNTQDPEQVLFTFAETAAMTRLRESWLRQQVAERRITHRRLGKHVRFSRADIDALITASAVPAA